MKTIVAVLITAVMAAGGARAYDAAVTPTQFAQLQMRVATLERFQRNCLRYQVHLWEHNGVMEWGVGLATPNAARFYAIPDTPVVPYYCR